MLTDIRQIEQGQNSAKFKRNKNLADAAFSVTLTHSKGQTLDLVF